MFKCGVGVSVNRASSTTEPSSASISSVRRASTSCSIEVLWCPTRSAPAMRFSIGTRKVMPSLSAMLCASLIMSCARSRLKGYWQMPASVARDSALIGLKVRFPHSFNQISARMSLSTGACRPPRMKHSDTRVDPLARRPVGFSDREPVALDVFDDAGRDAIRSPDTPRSRSRARREYARRSPRWIDAA